MDLEDEIFGTGAGSELSEVSDVEDEHEVPERRAIGRIASTDEEDEEEAASEEDDDEDEARANRLDHGDADYAAGREGGDDEGLPRKKRLPSFKKTGRGRVEGEPVRLRKKAKKQKLPEEEEEEAPVILDPEQQRKADLNARLDALIKPKKPKKARRKAAGDEELGDLAEEEEAAKLRQAMLTAAKTDIDANGEMRPATAKLRLLPTVTSTLQKSHLEPTLFDQNVLEAVKQWLEPLPDKSLPALNIQRELFDILVKMNIDTPTLKESELGKVVLFYTKSKRVDPSIKRLADTLVMNWMRPIIRRSSSYRQRNVVMADATATNAPPVIRARSLAPQAAAAEGDAVRRRAVIPAPLMAAYTVAPRSRVAPSAGGAGGGARSAEGAKLRELRKKLGSSKASRT